MWKYEYLEDETPKLLIEGPGKFRVTSVTTTKKDGTPIANNGLKVTMDIWDSAQDKSSCSKIFPSSQNMAWLFRSFARSIEAPQIFNRSGALDENALIGKHGPCLLETLTNQYTDRNGFAKTNVQTVIKGFLTPDASYVGPVVTGNEDYNGIPF